MRRQTFFLERKSQFCEFAYDGLDGIDRDFVVDFLALLRTDEVGFVDFSRDGT